MRAEMTERQRSGKCGCDDAVRREKRGCGSARKEESSARDGVTEGGKGRSDGPLPSQAQHAADHTRPKSMWSRETKRCWAFMRLIEQYRVLPVKQRPDAGPADPAPATRC
ncbi:hypothetical protein GCM10010423_55580 [Streptomyces levis]|uniref:Transposase n=1 Tax=Streptomyces levis TaxID=285566 RepID=A0ABN3P3I8_9ACTN